MNLYAENILDHYKNPRHFGKLEHASCFAKGNNPLCGDKLEVYLEVKDGKIISASFTGEGCAISKASIDLLIEDLIGQPVSKALELSADDVVELLGIEVSGTRIKCATLGYHAIKDALKGEKSHKH